MENIDIKQIVEIVGYIGSAMVIVSMLMTSVVKLRVINMTGSVIFGVYALCIHSYPTAAMQVALIIINAVNLYKLLSTKKEYSVVKMNSNDSFVSHFLKQNQDDIKKIFPEFNSIEQNDSVYIICCHSEGAGIFVASQNQDNSLNVKLDYTTPAYRDTSVGAFLYSQLAEQGIKKLKAVSNNLQHQKYLKKMGFTKSENDFVKTLTN